VAVTLFAVCTWLLTRLPPKSRRIRYWLWFAASIKFLIPARSSPPV
jgi:hypothetical protein